MPMEAAKQVKRTFGKALSVDRENFTLTAVMSTTTKDRDGDVVESEGAQLEHFLKDPVVLWAHDKKAPPIARVDEVLRSSDSIMGLIRFDKDDPFARMIFNKYANGFMNAWSIGFQAEKADPITDENGMVTGFHFTSWSLNELSAVPVPANPEALTRAFEGINEKGMAERFAKGVADVCHDDDTILNMVKELLDKKFGKGQHNSTVADEEPSWGSVDKGSLPEVAFAWEAPNTDAEKKSTWKYPHHWVENGGNKDDEGVFESGTLYLHEGGLSAAWAAAMGARSGQQAPQAVIDHLKKHRDALGIKEVRTFAVYNKEHPSGAIFSQEEDGDPVLVEKTFGDASFKKTIEERGEAGKIPLAISFGDDLEVVVDFDVLQEKDDVITEVRVKSTVVVLPPTKSAEAPTQKEPGREDDEEGQEPSASGEATDLSLEELETELADLDARVSTLD